MTGTLATTLQCELELISCGLSEDTVQDSEGTRKLESILVDERGGDKEVRKVRRPWKWRDITFRYLFVTGVTHRTAWNVL